MRLAVPDSVPDEFRQAILSARPELADTTFAVAGRGWHSLAVDVGGSHIAKFPDGEEAEAALRREASLLKAVRPAVAIPVPDMILHEGPPLFSLHPLLKGGGLERPAYRSLDTTRRDALGRDLARFLADLHAIDPARMRMAGAQAIGVWDTEDETLAPIWPLLEETCRTAGQRAIAGYRALGPDPHGEVYGFFDAHGWNMAFDHAAGRLNGIFDFADSGFGPLHREFVPVSFIDPDLTIRAMRAYGEITGRVIDAERVHLLTSAMLASELAGAIEIGGDEAATRTSLLEWLAGRDGFLAAANGG